MRHNTITYIRLVLIRTRHPFDTIKVRLQTSSKTQFKGPLDCVLQTLRKEGVNGIYKGGMSHPSTGNEISANYDSHASADRMVSKVSLVQQSTCVHELISVAGCAWTPSCSAPSLCIDAY